MENMQRVSIWFLDQSSMHIYLRTHCCFIQTQIKYLWVAGYYPACAGTSTGMIICACVVISGLFDNKNKPEMLHKYSKARFNCLSLFIIKSVVFVPRLTCLLRK